VSEQPPETTTATTTASASDVSTGVAPYDPRDWVTPEDLNVAPDLLGAPLASPRRRLYAIAVDVSIVVLLSDIGNIWLVAGVGLIAMMYVRKPMHDSMNRKLAVWALAAALIGMGVWQAVESSHEPHASHHEKRKQREQEDDVDVAKELGKVSSGLAPEKLSALRIEQLEAELIEARKPKPFDLKETIRDWTEDVGLSLSWAIAYFSLFPAWWNGQTPGKRLFGLRVVELTGKPITVMRAFKRYGGYAAGMATGAFGFAQVFWDPNRQAIQDKTAHTVVIDLRRKLRRLPPTETETP
jgi:hypothetical protein